MKHFSDLLDIDIQAEVHIRIHAITNSGLPRTWVQVNDQEKFNATLSDDLEIYTKIDITKPFKIEIGMDDKIYREDRETAIVIESLTIDGFELIPNFIHLAKYHNDHGRDEPTYYLGWNGTWVLDSDRPFYQWLHRATGQGWILDFI